MMPSLGTEDDLEVSSSELSGGVIGTESLWALSLNSQVVVSLRETKG